MRPCVEEARPHALGKAEVGAVIAVQVTDLPSSHLECELTAAARSCQHTWPGGDLLGDPLARPLPVCHDYLLAFQSSARLRSTTSPPSAFPADRVPWSATRSDAPPLAVACREARTRPRNDESITLVGEAVEEIPVPIERPDAKHPGEDTAEEERHRERRTNLRGSESEPERDGASARSSHCS